MTLFVVAFFVIAVLVLLLWLLMRPLADEPPPALWKEEPPSIFGAADPPRCFDKQVEADASASDFAADERQRRAG
jgi:hypothetical protein